MTLRPMARHRTLNRQAAANTPADVYRYNPWRRPGNAPSFDACGMAGGQWTPATAGAEYRTTKYAKMGDLGSVVLKKLPTGVVWEAGGLAEVSFYIKTNHGGGYQYRLCPAGEALTEACFQRTPLAFATTTQAPPPPPPSPSSRPLPRPPLPLRPLSLPSAGPSPLARPRWWQVLRFADREERITGTYVTEGTTPAGRCRRAAAEPCRDDGITAPPPRRDATTTPPPPHGGAGRSAWAMNPVPMCGEATTRTTDPSGNVHTCPAGTPANRTNFPYPARCPAPPRAGGLCRGRAPPAPGPRAC
jgi:hypothetical protein